MSATANAIFILDLLQAGVTITNEIDEAIRRAESEGRNITMAELAEDAVEIRALYAETIRKLS